MPIAASSYIHTPTIYHFHIGVQIIGVFDKTHVDLVYDHLKMEDKKK